MDLQQIRKVTEVLNVVRAVQISEVLSEREKRLISGETAENYFGIEP